MEIGPDALWGFEKIWFRFTFKKRSNEVAKE